jgi:hypothetical protein
MVTMSKAQAKKTSVMALSCPVSTWMWQVVDNRGGQVVKGVVIRGYKEG